jgi:hypothetical protein
MNATVCSINPPGHDWENGLVCRWCQETRTPEDAVLSQLASRRGGNPAAARALLDAYRAEVLAEIANPADAATIYATRPCGCEEAEHPTWCPASVPNDARIAEIRNGAGDGLTPRELSWLKGAAARHELHVIGARGLHWPLDDDLPGALLLISQYLAAAVAVIERAGLTTEESDAGPADGQAYDGELAMLRDLVRTLHTVAAADDNLNEVRRRLHQHALDDLAARTGDIEKTDTTEDVTA